MKIKKEIILIGSLILALLIGTGVIVYIMNRGASQTEEAANVESELFQNIPVIKGKEITLTEPRDVGDGNYVIDVEKTTLAEYYEYLSVLEGEGFKKIVDNGKDGIEGEVYVSYYQKGKLTVQICHFVNLQKTMINACEDAEISENLFYDEAKVSKNTGDRKTKLHSPELYTYGNSYIIELKNGKFILNDGGTATETPYLIDYLESLVPEGEKPVIEAWFISHAHFDHMGVLDKISDEPRYADRIYVEKVYFNEPSKEAIKSPSGVFDTVGRLVTICRASKSFLKSTDGKGPNVYRTRMGDRLYFDDITVDVIYSQELIDHSQWKTWNSTSTVLMYTIEGQKVLITADTDWECQKMYMDIFDSTYFNLTVYQAPHHGKNVFNAFTNHCSHIQTVIYPTEVKGSNASETNFAGRSVQNQYLQSRALEALSYGDGTKILTFPYTVGSAESLPEPEWIYNATPPAWKATTK